MSYVLGQFETMVLPGGAQQAVVDMIGPGVVPSTPAVKASAIPKVLLGAGAVIALVTLLKK